MCCHVITVLVGELNREEQLPSNSQAGADHILKSYGKLVLFGLGYTFTFEIPGGKGVVCHAQHFVASSSSAVSMFSTC